MSKIAVVSEGRVRELIAQHPETKQHLEELFATMEYGNLNDVLALQVTDERWGRDPSQHPPTRSWSVSFNTVSSTSYGSWTSTSTGNSTYVIVGA